MGIFDPPDPPENGIWARQYRLPGDSHSKLPLAPEWDWAPLVGYYRKTTMGPSPRPLTRGEALQAQERERQNLAAAAHWTAQQERKRRTAKKYAPPPPPPRLFVEKKYTPRPTPVLQFESLTFYESGISLPPKEQRQYSTRFPQHTARFIIFELTVRNWLYRQRGQTRRVVARYYSPDGSLRETNTPFDWVITSAAETSRYISGRGWRDPGYWKPGTYRVEILIDRVRFAQGSFTIAS